MSKPMINLADAPLRTEQSGEHFAHTIAPLAGSLGAKLIGTNVTRVPPGKAAWPLHHHYANEEHFFILSGTGKLRVGDAVHAVRQHDYIVNPAGGTEVAHQLINTGTEDLVYLAISTLISPEVVGYPDSAKTGVRSAAVGQPGEFFLIPETAKRMRNAEEYWRGEDGAQVAAVVARGK